MPRSRFTWTILLIASLVLGTAWTLQSREVVQSATTAQSGVEAPAVGHTAPDFTLETLQAEPFRLSNVRGQPIVLNFWATWCPPCRAEIPFLQEASRKYNGQLLVVGVDQGEARTTVAAFARNLNMTYPIPLDQENSVSRLYNANALPITYFIDANGIVQYIHIGILNQAILESQIIDLLQ